MSLKRLFALLLGLGLLSGVGQTGWAAKSDSKSLVQNMRESGFSFKTASWTALSTQKDSRGKVTKSEVKIQISGDQYRLETKNPENGEKMVFIDTGKVKYMYMPDDKKALKLTPRMQEMYSGILSSDLVAESARQRKKAKKVGKGKVDGKPCTIYTYKSTLKMMGGTITSDVKEWVWNKKNFPLKSMVKTPKQKMNTGFSTVELPASETETVIKDLVLDKKIPASRFKLPAGTKIEEPEEMDMPRGSGRPKMPPLPTGEDAPPPEVQDMLKNLF